MNKESQSWSIIVFAYNEAGNIEKVLAQIESFFSALPEEKKECLIIDDGSHDGTYEVAAKWEQRYSWLHVIRHEENRGIHAALQTGYANARCENVVAVPGDGQFDINELRAFRNIPDNTIISFYRTQRPGYGPLRNALSNTNKILNLFVLGLWIRDVNWVKVYKKASLDQLRLDSTSVLFETGLCAQILANGSRLVQIPCRYLPRDYGSAKGANFKTVSRVVSDMLPFYLKTFSSTIPRRIRNTFYKRS